MEDPTDDLPTDEEDPTIAPDMDGQDNFDDAIALDNSEADGAEQQPQDQRKRKNR